MSDFFSGVRGAEMPSVVWNSGPLPPAGGLPAPLHDTPDARINYNSTLLGDLTPYAYGEPGYLSSQTAYLNIPHKLQKLIPLLHLPALNREGTFELSHPVDDGDIAFVVRMNRHSVFCNGINYDSPLRKNGLGAAIDCFVNLPTLNYILFGVYTTLHCPAEERNDNVECWKQFLGSLDMDADALAGKTWKETLGVIVRDKIKPFGIVRGSEKQGGQTEATLSPVTWTAAFVVNLVIDGKEDNVLNIWHENELGAGDDLILRWAQVDCKDVPLSFTLNHYYKKVVRENVHRGWKNKTRGGCYFLVPDVFTLNLRLDNKNYEKNFLWQTHGFWHIARTQIQCSRYNVAGNIFFDDCTNLLRGVPIEVTFQPMYMRGLGPDYFEDPVTRVSLVAEAVAEGPSSLFLESLVRPVPSQAAASPPAPSQPAPNLRDSMRRRAMHVAGLRVSTQEPVPLPSLRVSRQEPVALPSLRVSTQAPVELPKAEPTTVRVTTGAGGAGSINIQEAARLLAQTSPLDDPNPKAGKGPVQRKRAAPDAGGTKGVLLRDDGVAQPETGRLLPQ